MRSQILMLFTALILMSSCRQSNPENKEGVLEGRSSEEQKWKADTSFVPPPGQEPEQAGIQQDWDKKIVRKGFLQIEVKDFKKYGNDLNNQVKQAGGYIAGEATQQTEERLENRVVIKVPVAQFSSLMILLSDTKEQVWDKKISSEEVTTDIIDTRLRIEAKKKIRQRYLDLLQQAKSMEDILRIQSEINNVQEQIELGEGRAAYLNHSAAMSTIELTYYQLLAGNGPGRDTSFTVQLRRAFAGGWEAIKELLLVLVSIWPLFLVLITGLIVFKRTKVAKAKTVN
jgi:hypothetical protein